MKENIKLVLLGIIALATVTNVFILSSSKNNEDELVVDDTQSSVVATNVANENVNLINPSDPIIQPPVQNPIPNPNTKTTSIRWKKMVHDFGKIKQNTKNNYAFEFQNTGTEPLQITDAKGSCGCTVPQYPKEPIMPGKTAKIDVEFKPGEQENQQEKTITVTANTEPYQTILKIRAFVEK